MIETEGSEDGMIETEGSKDGMIETEGSKDGMMETEGSKDGMIETDGFDDGCFCRGKHISDKKKDCSRMIALRLNILPMAQGLVK